MNENPQPIDATARTELILPEKAESSLATAGLSGEGAASLRRAFAEHFARFNEVSGEAAAVRPDEPAKARALRLALKNIRTASERTRKELKEDSLHRGKAIDGIHAVLEYALVPIEQAMDAIEKAEERAKAARIAAIKTAREEELRPFGDPAFYDLGNMPEGAFAALLSGAKAVVAAKEAAAEKERADAAERDRAVAAAKIKKDQEDAAEREQMRTENAWLAQVAAEERAKREQQEVAAKVERERVEALFRVSKNLADSQAKAEREKREAAERELARIAEEKADQIAAEVAATKKAAAAPDREKLFATAAAIRGTAVPALSTDGGAALGLRIREQLEKFAAWIESEAAKV